MSHNFGGVDADQQLSFALLLAASHDAQQGIEASFVVPPSSSSTSDMASAASTPSLDQPQDPAAGAAGRAQRHRKILRDAMTALDRQDHMLRELVGDVDYFRGKLSRCLNDDYGSDDDEEDGDGEDEHSLVFHGFDAPGAILCDSGHGSGSNNSNGSGHSVGLFAVNGDNNISDDAAIVAAPASAVPATEAVAVPAANASQVDEFAGAIDSKTVGAFKSLRIAMANLKHAFDASKQDIEAIYASIDAVKDDGNGKWDNATNVWVCKEDVKIESYSDLDLLEKSRRLARRPTT